MASKILQPTYEPVLTSSPWDEYMELTCRMQLCEKSFLLVCSMDIRDMRDSHGEFLLEDYYE